MTSLSLYDYPLPRASIAQEPAAKRDGSRILFTERGRSQLSAALFHELPRRLRGDECLVINDTRVIPARLRARRQSGGRVEVFLLRYLGDGVWWGWLSPARRVRRGETLSANGAPVEVLDRDGSFWRVRAGDEERVARIGETPLPPYIEREPADPRLAGLDARRYQTIYAHSPGAVAAPTAGLHFTEPLLARIRACGIPVVPVTLHVGPATFAPIRTPDVHMHRVLPEPFFVSEESRAALCRARREGRKIVCVGTTTLRLLESLPDLEEGPEICGETSLTILPGHRFRHTAGLITNFHLPCSSLLVLVASFHGRRRTLDAYRRAQELGFRFYSYGDAMGILPARDSC